MDDYIVSVVIAAKNPPLESLDLCLSSFSALKFANRMQLVIVESGEPAPLHSSRLVGFGNVKRLQVPAEGVYSAYNAGISNSDGRYLLFFGVDDIALPGMDAVIAHLYEKPDAYVLYAGACYMQSRGVHRPSTKRTSLIFANWCHQGIFYKREYLASHHYEVRYRMQADHKMNIDIISNRSFSFGVSHEMVAYFSAGGVSSVSPDLVFRKNFSSIVSDAYGRHWGLFIILKQKLIDIILGSPEKRFRPYEKN